VEDTKLSTLELKSARSGWIGGNAGPVWPPYSTFGEDMSALAVVRTESGLVIAADGRTRNRDGSETAKTSEKEQKIFRARFYGVDCAWAALGVICSEGNEGQSFDLRNETANAIQDFRERRAPLDQSVDKIMHRLNAYIAQAWKDGQIEPNPYEPDSPHGNAVASVFLIGYIQVDCPTLINITFSRDSVGLAQPSRVIESSPDNRYSGSWKVAAMYGKGAANPLFGKYYWPPRPFLADGLANATGFIQACKDPAAREIDPGCEYIGGHIHAAFVTPKNGFRWAPGFEPEADASGRQARSERTEGKKPLVARVVKAFRSLFLRR
jgi:hypothetical protein